MIDREKLRAEFRAYLNENKSEIDTVSNIIINTIPQDTEMEINPAVDTINKVVGVDIDIVQKKPRVSRVEDSVFGEFN